jgi:hypothetical protein
VRRACGPHNSGEGSQRLAAPRPCATVGSARPDERVAAVDLDHETFPILRDNELFCMP